MLSNELADSEGAGSTDRRQGLASGVSALDGQERPHRITAAGEVCDAAADLRQRAERLGIEYRATLGDCSASAEFVEHVPIRYARRRAVFAFLPPSQIDGTCLAIGSLSSWPQLDVLRRYLRRNLRPVFVPESEILRAINAAYQQQDGQAHSLIEQIDQDVSVDELAEPDGKEDLLDSGGRPVVIRLVNSILFEAIKARASDVHLQPDEQGLLVRQRIDGVLFDTIRIPKDRQEEVISRVKVLGKMNIAEKRLPQDGRATVHVGDRLIDLRIASLPTSYGERVVVRFLDKSARLYTLGELGMANDHLTVFRRLLRREHGLLLVTGPTGAGKSTTLYAALQEINAKDLNVLTLEDPIEYQLDRISQTQVNPKKGLTFASGLRNVLRQDPDIIMVGEIRDRETAEMAIQSALTGHLVFSTLHTNDAASAVTRLLDLDVEPYLVASSLIAVVAQRLVRRICDECKASFHASTAELLGLAIEPNRVALEQVFRGKGCGACRSTGYHGRIGVFELMEVTDNVRELVQSRANAAQIRTAAVAKGMRLLRDDALNKVKQGTTTLDEVVRVTTEVEE